MEVIGTGISLDEFPFEPNANRKEQIMFVGSLIERKGVNQLLEALTHVQQQVPGCRLLIVGEGVERQHLEQQAEQLGLSGMVTFMGNQSQAEVSRLLRESKVFVLPSIEEGQGVVLVEALASGTPCVGSDVGGIPGVISGVGLLVPPASPTALAEGILRFLKDPDLWQRSSTEGRKRAEEKYDWDVLVRQIVRVYAEVLGNLPPNGVVRVGER
ncbi:MAG: glycosyltransferase family 4 protein [Anaerolineaceae bacterium]|nr:glycosyltransferase family 4 protein [Anaerolineaceae bacterium]